MNLAPVILFVYNRPWHTEQTLNALMLNKYANESILYIYCDGPKLNASIEEINRIEAVRKIARKKNWCKEIIIEERNSNLGLAESVIQGVTKVIEKHGRVIVLEDDILTGVYFLKYMNDALNIYKNEKGVFGISGYKFPSLKEINNPTYFLPIASSWSYATWNDRWQKVNFKGQELLAKINRHKLRKKMNFGNYFFYEMLKNQTENKVDSWAIRFYASMFLEHAFFLFPNVSLVKNIGFDNSGVHCGIDEYFEKVSIENQNILVIKQNVVLNKKIVNSIRHSFEFEHAKNNWYNLLILKSSSFFQRGLNKINFFLR